MRAPLSRMRIFCLVLAVAWVALSVAPAAESSAGFAYEESDAAADAVLAAVRAADEERVAASIAVDRDRLAAVLSDELHYAHSNGSIDSKESYLESIVAGRSVYTSYDYQERIFRPVAPGVVLMTGRTVIGSRNAEGPITIDLNFLAVWRNEGGAWRMLAWQSCRNPPPRPAP